MKINSTLFTVVMIMFVAAISYYVGSSMKGRAPIKDPHTKTAIRDGTSSDTSDDASNNTGNDTGKGPIQEQPAVSKTPSTNSQQTETVNSCVIVTGILFSEESPSAVINGNVVGEGKDVNGVKVLKIHRDYVEFEKAGRHWNQTTTANNAKPGCLTGSGQQNNQMLPSMPVSQNAAEDLSLRYKLYLDIAKTEYDNEIANAGNNSLLVQKAQQRYTLSVAKIESWRRRVENAFRMINLDNRITEQERQMNRDRVLNATEEPMYVPKRIELLPDESKTNPGRTE
jgi:hypothetical protein